MTNPSIRLAEQHMREGQSRLRHIDELMTRARSARAAAPHTAGLEALLTQTQQDRDRFAHHLDDVRARPEALPGLLAHAEGLTGGLDAVGLQLEQALAAVFKSAPPAADANPLPHWRHHACARHRPAPRSRGKRIAAPFDRPKIR